MNEIYKDITSVFEEVTDMRKVLEDRLLEIIERVENDDSSEEVIIGIVE